MALGHLDFLPLSFDRTAISPLGTDKQVVIEGPRGVRSQWETSFPWDTGGDEDGGTSATGSAAVLVEGDQPAEGGATKRSGNRFGMQKLLSCRSDSAVETGSLCLQLSTPGQRRP